MLSYFLNNRFVTWTDRFRYLGIDFNCKDAVEVDVASVRKSFYAACNNIIAKGRGVMEPVAVQLVKSYCLPLLVYCVGALRFCLCQLSVCWNDAFRKKSFILRDLNLLKLCKLNLFRLIFNICMIYTDGSF